MCDIFLYMKISRIIYALLTTLLVWFYFQPWTIMGGQSFIGIAVIIPLSFFYFVGLIMAIIVLFTGHRAVKWSLIGGILMFGNNLIAGIMFGIIAATNHTQLGTGFVYTSFLSLIFMILGPIFASRFDTSKNVYVEKSLLKSVISGVVVGIIIIFIKQILKI